MTTIKSFDIESRDFQYVKSNGNGLIMDLSSFSFTDGALNTYTVNSSNSTAGNSNVYITNQITGYALDNTVLLTNTKLDSLNLVTTASNSGVIAAINGANTLILAANNTLSSINAHLTTYAKSTLHLDHETQGATTWSDSTLPWLVPANGEQGWQYINSNVGSAQLYYYGNTDLVNGGAESNIQLGTISGQYFLGNNRLITSVYQSKFILSIYTKPQFDGNDAQAWYRSRKVWTVGSEKVVSKGVDYLFYRGSSPADVYPEHKLIEMTLTSSNGPCADSEIVQFMAVSVDSNAQQDAFNGVVKMAGFSNTLGEHREVVFDNSREKEANDAVKQLSFLDDGYGNKDLRVLVRNASDIGVSVNNQPTVGLAAFTSVGITAGSEIGLASGAQVALVSGTEIGVTGTFWPETQPVSGTFWPETQPVSGTFWPETQPVTGTFWPETQPVTGEVAVTKSYNTNTIANNVSLTGPQQIGTAVEIGGFLHIGVQIDIASVSTPGNIYMEFSIDNNQYVRFSNDMTTSYYAMSTMAQQIGGIKLSNTPFRYIRLYADTGLTATGCTIKVITK